MSAVYLWESNCFDTEHGMANIKWKLHLPLRTFFPNTVRLTFYASLVHSLPLVYLASIILNQLVAIGTVRAE